MSQTRATEEDAGPWQGPGHVEGEGETATVSFQRFLHHPIADVWEAITDPKQLEVWFMAKTRRREGPGGLLEMEHPNGVHATGRVLEWSPPRTYEYEWNLPPGPTVPTGETSVVRWELQAAEGGTLLRMIHRRLSRGTAETFARGFRVLLDRLVAHLGGAPLPAPFWVKGSAGPFPVSRREP